MALEVLEAAPTKGYDMHAVLLALSLVMPAAFQTPAAAPSVNALGTWDLTFDTEQGQIAGQLVLEKDGDTIAGTISSQQGTISAEAHVEGKTLSVWFNYPGQDGTAPVEMTGTIDGDAVKGSFTFAGNPAGTFTGTHQKDPASSTPAAPSKGAAAPSLTGTWSVSLQLDSMSANPMLVLKQDGEKLTGEYQSEQYGTFALTGTVKANDVSISFPMSIQGTSMTVTYTATIEKDGSLEGRANYGDMMSGTFTATRKQ